MSVPQVMPARHGRLARRVLWSARLAILVAYVLRRQSPRRIQRVLRLLSKGARPATYDMASQARDVVTRTSLHCTGPEGCLPRSIATAVLCRLQGCFPVWCVGVRVTPPFGAHAWVMADGRDVDEPYPADYHRVLLRVDPVEAR